MASGMRNLDDTGGRKFISIPELCARWSVSHMKVERLLKSDSKFPKIYRFGPRGRTRHVDVADVERYERASVVAR